MDSKLILEKIFSEALNGVSSSQPYKMEVYGNREGDKVARQPTEGDKIAARPKLGDIAAQEKRLGDKVPCREGDVIAGVCNRGETPQDAQQRQAFEQIQKKIAAIMEQAKSSVGRQSSDSITSMPVPELTP